MIVINLDKAKDIAHDKRRKKREEEFQPYDNIIMKQIPGTDPTEAELARQEIREKYAILQEQINAAQTVDDLKQTIQPILES